MTELLNGSKDQRLLNFRRRFLDVKFDLEGTPYVAIENIGAGAYGVVCSAVDKNSNEKVAIKKTTHIFDAISTAKRTYREIKILRHFSHPNIISIKSIIVPKQKDFAELYVVFDLMESDLHKILSSKQPLSIEHTQYFLYQLLCGLKYVHSAGVTHRDLKPSNLLVNSNCQLKIGDFGMARSLPTAVQQQQQNQQPRQQQGSSQSAPTIYVATRWYRAPELLLGHPSYTSSVDLWSTGCILAEMLNRAPLFPGSDCIRQLGLIVGRLGPPPQELLAASCSDVIRDLVSGMAAQPPVPLSVLFPGATRKAVDLMGKLLCYLPHRRLTAEQALGHLFLNRFRNPLAEPACSAPFDPAALEPPDETREGLRAALLDEAQKAALATPTTEATPPTAALAAAPAAEHMPAATAAATAAAAATTVSHSKPAPAPGSKSKGQQKSSACGTVGTSSGTSGHHHYVNRSKYFRNCEGPRITVSEHTKDMLKRALLGSRDSGAEGGPSGGGGRGGGRLTAAQRKQEREARKQRAEQRRRRVGNLNAASTAAAADISAASAIDAASAAGKAPASVAKPGVSMATGVTAVIGVGGVASTTGAAADLSTEDQRCLEKWRRLTPAQRMAPQQLPQAQILQSDQQQPPMLDCLVSGCGGAPAMTPPNLPIQLPIVPSRISIDLDTEDNDAEAAALSADFMQMLGLEDVANPCASSAAAVGGAGFQSFAPAPLQTPRGTGLGYGISISDLDGDDADGQLDMFNQMGLEQPTSAEAMRDFLDVCNGLDLQLS